ncbi:unnamed protein product [Durusdinium trenchii]|uniref:Uncharacterized protein n=1 Tax=Durusdinium trenchii TaxID=1381693 RepID=A0ABP0SC07_9DINO
MSSFSERRPVRKTRGSDQTTRFRSCEWLRNVQAGSGAQRERPVIGLGILELANRRRTGARFCRGFLSNKSNKRNITKQACFFEVTESSPVTQVTCMFKAGDEDGTTSDPDEESPGLSPNPFLSATNWV